MSLHQRPAVGPQAPRARASGSGCPGWGSCCCWRGRCFHSCWWMRKRRPWTPRNQANASPAQQAREHRQVSQTGGFDFCSSLKLTRSSFTTVSSSSSFPLSHGWKYLKPCEKKQFKKNQKQKHQKNIAFGT